MPNVDETSVPMTIKYIVVSDIRKYAEELKISERELIKDFAKNTNVSLRTLERLLEDNKKTVPHVRTIVDIYSQLYNATSLAEIITKVSPLVSEFIKKNHTQFAVKDHEVSDISSNSAVQTALTSSTIFNQIYIMTNGVYGTDLATIREYFGISGLKHLDEMIKLGFIEIDDNDQIKRKKKLTWDRSIRKNFIKTILNDVYEDENTDTELSNYMGVAIGDVTPEDYIKIRKKMCSHYLELMDIINNSNPTYEKTVKIALGKVMDKIEYKVEGDRLC